MSTPVVPGYELVSWLGRGGMGEVWLGRRPVVGGVAKSVAIKLVRLDPGDPRSVRTFVEEARVSMLLGHSNIVQVFDVGTTDTFGYLVSEAVDGVDLARLVRGLGKLGAGVSPEVSAYVVGQILRGLAYAHRLVLEGRALEIVHRDVSPHNVLVSVSGEVKLIDFGIARWALRETTGIGVKGKLHYMAPEQFAGGAVDARSDLYAVGAILHELLTGWPLRTGDDVGALYGQLAAPTIPDAPAGTDPVLDKLRRWLLQPVPAQRIASAHDALALLSRSARYRDANLELAALCQRVTGIEAPRAEVRGTEAPPRTTRHGVLTGSATWDSGATEGGGVTSEVPSTIQSGVHHGAMRPAASYGGVRASGGSRGSESRAGSSSASRLAVVVGVLVVGFAVIGLAVKLLSSDEGSGEAAHASSSVADSSHADSSVAADSSSPEPWLTTPVEPNAKWASGFCSMKRRDGSDALAGFARIDGDKRRVLVDAQSGAITRSDPADDERAMFCLTPTVLAIETGPPDGPDDAVTEVRFVNVEGETIATRPLTAEASQSWMPSGSGCIWGPEMLFGFEPANDTVVSKCPDNPVFGGVGARTWDWIALESHSSALLDDGFVDVEFGAAVADPMVTRWLAAPVRRHVSPPSDGKRVWRVQLRGVDAPPGIAIAATRDAVGVTTVDRTSRRLGMIVLDLGDGHELGRIDLAPHIFAAADIGATDSLILLSLGGPPGLLAVDPRGPDGPLLEWRLGGGPMMGT